jgi:hypothetical protein
MRRVRLSVLLVAIVCALASGVFAQTPAARFGALHVTVRDGTTLPVAGARVLVTSAAGVAIERFTGDRGIAEFEGLTPGRYHVAIELAGFEPAAIANVGVRAGARTSRDAELTVAGVREELEVLPGDTDAQLNDAFTTVLDAEQIGGLPEDPEELALIIAQLVGPDAEIRIDGFANSELPPGTQIQSIRIRYDGGSAGNANGGPRVEIRTRPGGDRWRTDASFRVRDEALTARNAFSPERPQGQARNYTWSVNGPVRMEKTGLSFTLERNSSIGQEAIRAATEDGIFSALIPLPNERSVISTSLEHALTASQRIRVDFRNARGEASNLGLGELDLPERSFSREDGDGHLRVGHNATLRGAMVHDARLQLRWRSNHATPASVGTATHVLGAFASGGAQVQGGRRVRELELEDELMFPIRGRHHVTTGVNVIGAHFAGDEWRNAGGSYTFASLDDFRLKRPMTFTQRVGDPAFAYSIYRFGAFVQGDFRVHRTLMLHAGLRHESQTHLGDWANFAPRVGFNWMLVPRRRTSLRASYNVTFQPLQGSVYEQTRLVNGEQQHDLVIEQPSYPNPFVGATSADDRPPAIVRRDPAMIMPSTGRTSVALEQPLGKALRLRATYLRNAGRHQFRSIDANAARNGSRPDGALWTVTELQSSARARSQSLELNASLSKPRPRIHLNATYTLGEQLNETDGALTLPPDSFDLDQEWGPARQDIRHRFNASFNTDLWLGFRLNAHGRMQSAAPYTITTGIDTNGDGVNTERPPGVGRNSVRGAGSKVLDLTLTWQLDIGQRAMPPGRARPPNAPAQRPSPLVHLELFVQSNNVFNAVNFQAFNGVQSSRFFGQPTSASAPRRFSLGARMSL